METGEHTNQAQVFKCGHTQVCIASEQYAAAHQCYVCKRKQMTATRIKNKEAKENLK